MYKKILISGALLGGLAVVLGALGAHTWKPLLIERGRVETFELAVYYQFYHALLLLIIGLFANAFGARMSLYAAAAIFFGLVMFSGSLYLLSLSTVPVWGMITPIGGMLLVLGWLLLAVGVWKKHKTGRIQ